jgi:hypothetical protein
MKQIMIERLLLIEIVSVFALDLGLCERASGEVLVYDRSIAPSSVNDIGYNNTGSGQRIAEKFSFSSALYLNNITFLGGYFPDNTPGVDSFTLTIYNNDSVRNLPNSSSIVAQINLGDFGRVDTGVFVLGTELYQYTTSFAAVPIAANSTYWFTIVNNTINDDWVWAGNRSVGIWGRSFDGGASWFDAPAGSFSFSLEGTTTIPEPPSVTVAALACLLLGIIRQRGRERVGS